MPVEELTLEELKAQNKAEEDALEQKTTDQDESDDLIEGTEDTEYDSDDSDQQSDDQEGEDNEDETKQTDQKLAWMSEDEEDDEEDTRTVPLRTFINKRNKLRGQLSEKDSEIERLREENELLKRQAPAPKGLVRPNIDDYDRDEDYIAAVKKYELELIDSRLAEREQIQQQQAAIIKQQQAVESSVNAHYDRADKLVKEHGIEPDTYKKADRNLRKKIDTLKPGQGDIVVDQLIHTLGAGSEKVIYYLGINESASNKLLSLLLEDSSGLKVAAFLGKEQQRLSTVQKRRSNAPKPAKRHKGDAPVTNSKGLHRKYNDAHKRGDAQAAYNAKKQAKANGIDVSGW